MRIKIMVENPPIILDGSNKVDIQKTLETEYYDIPSYIMDMFMYY